jgi:hypothetical protein
VPPQRLDDRLRLTVEPRPGDPRGLDPGEQQLVISFPVLLEGQPRPVRLVDVEFDPEALRLPPGVDLVAGDRRSSPERVKTARPTVRSREFLEVVTDAGQSTARSRMVLAREVTGIPSRLARSAEARSARCSAKSRLP